MFGHHPAHWNIRERPASSLLVAASEPCQCSMPMGRVRENGKFDYEQAYSSRNDITGKSIGGSQLRVHIFGFSSEVMKRTRELTETEQLQERSATSCSRRIPLGLRKDPKPDRHLDWVERRLEKQQSVEPASCNSHDGRTIDWTQFG